VSRTGFGDAAFRPEIREEGPMFWMFMTALWVVMLAAPLVLLVALLPTGRDCPRCGGESLPIQPRLLRPLRRYLLPRWCTACGWEGYTRTAVPAPIPGLDLAHQPAEEPDPDAVWRGEKRDPRS
jgi:hypothetical protein